ncbi:hypothetical protein CkaCkLH20_12595 [Colletotrichum karsti]|uniref:Rhodopsin domain-containing protein n=1 Tax=Colletotrichum karsti TaxID=1095194 RepID=A0A9P6LED6_9PEZI|nr:uncharacterized protein CkaCkLH20_12595 [Colletotrichum karsti]KAF9869986.1 hypothetical protein CkaCkLH20_12595 [Colletotrichum karsti]
MDPATTDDLILAMVAEEDPAVDASETRAPLVIGVTVTALFVATVATMLRVYVRKYVLRRWGPDDSALVASYILVFLTGLLMLINTHYGDGRHAATLPRADYLKTQEIAIAAVAVYQVAYPLIKTTFLLQYRRVFPLPPFKKLCNMFAIFILTFGFTQVVSLCFACVPLRALWDFTVQGKCIHLLEWWYIGSSINLITDLVIFFMPVPLLRTLGVPMKQKLILMATFGLGFFTCAISVVRLTTLKQSSQSTDPTYNTVIAGVWSLTELCCGVVCVCVPTLRPLLGTHSQTVKIRTHLERRIHDSADTELYTQSSGGTTSKKRRSGIMSATLHEALEDPESPRTLTDYARNTADVATPPKIHVDEARETREQLRQAMAMTLPLTRVDTEDGVEFLMLEAPGHDPEVPTPLAPPPRRHTDRGNRQSEGGDYFGALVWDPKGQPSIPENTSQETISPGGKGDDPP